MKKAFKIFLLNMGIFLFVTLIIYWALFDVYNPFEWIFHIPEWEWYQRIGILGFFLFYNIGSYNALMFLEAPKKITVRNTQLKAIGSLDKDEIEEKEVENPERFMRGGNVVMSYIAALSCLATFSECTNCK